MDRELDRELDREFAALTQASKFFPTRPCGATVRRWALLGARGVILKSVVIGAVRYTSREWADEFIAALNSAPPAAPPADSPADHATTSARAADASKRLAAAGF